MKLLNLINTYNFEGFDWDRGNINKNWISHKVSPNECEEIFFNHPLLVTDDHQHSIIEKRYYSLGHTNKNRLLTVVFTIRKNMVRIISARDMSIKEREVYKNAVEKIKKNSGI